MSNFHCEYCKKSFVKELTLINHSCEKKRRWFNKDKPFSRFAFLAWHQFYQLNQFNKKPNYSISFQNFMESKFYNSFIKFGKFICDANIIEPEKFINYVLRNNLPIDKWTNDFVYEQYIHELIRTELPEDALTRNISFMEEWALKENKPWYEFFKHVNTNQAIFWIKTGRISPWLLYNVNSAEDFLNRCSQEQLAMIQATAPVTLWDLKFKKNKESCSFIRETLKRSGM